MLGMDDFVPCPGGCGRRVHPLFGGDCRLHLDAAPTPPVVHELTVDELEPDDPDTEIVFTDGSLTTTTEIPVKRRPGRPRKNPA